VFDKNISPFLLLIFFSKNLQVGFWTIRVWAQGQIEEKQIKVEKYYRPKFEVFVRMPTFVFDTDQVSHLFALV
jgi:hypothetical protein